ncbi:MAG: crotonase/enoyl-CoA hydratase family protein [Halioglobus sp.]|nr:crotonase/enoyl-CoA hydratase family protein [Halioglobus sp.]
MDITLSLEDDVALIKWDDGKKNAITVDALRAINSALDEAERKAKAIVIAGRPGSFCAGFDLAVMTGGDTVAITTLGRQGALFATRLFGLEKPLVAACTGHAFTIGAFWLLACDTRIGEQGKFKFGFNETAMGMVLPAWAIALLQARINPNLFLPTVAQARLYNPAGAVEAGLLDTLVHDGEAIAAALAQAQQLAALPAAAYAGNKLSSRTSTLEIMRGDLL